MGERSCRGERCLQAKAEVGKRRCLHFWATFTVELYVSSCSSLCLVVIFCGLVGPSLLVGLACLDCVVSMLHGRSCAVARAVKACVCSVRLAEVFKWVVSGLVADWAWEVVFMLSVAGCAVATWLLVLCVDAVSVDVVMLMLVRSLGTAVSSSRWRPSVAFAWGIEGKMKVTH